MSVFPGSEGPLMGEGPRHEVVPIEVYGHVEGLVQEETELLETEELTDEQHRRLHAISAELDRIFEHLHLRAHGHRHGSPPGAGDPPA